MGVCENCKASYMYKRNGMKVCLSKINELFEKWPTGVNRKY